VWSAIFLRLKNAPALRPILVPKFQPYVKKPLGFNPFQSNFSANRILPQLLFVLGSKEVGGLLVIIPQF
jgi:hypothetical protein